MTSLLEILGLPAEGLLLAARALLGTVTWFGDPPGTGATLVLAAVLLRLAVLPLWARALPGRRLNAVCVPLLRAIRASHPDDPRAQARARGDLLVRFRFPARITHAAVAVTAVNSAACLLWADVLADGAPAYGPYSAGLWTTPGHDRWKLLAAVVCAALGWYQQWYTEERRTLTHLMPEPVWDEQFARRNRLLVIGLPLAWALLLLPLGALVLLLVWQVAGQVPSAVVIARGGTVAPPGLLGARYPTPSEPSAPPGGTSPAPSVPGPAVPGLPAPSAPVPAREPGPAPFAVAPVRPVPEPRSPVSPLAQPPQTQPLSSRDPRNIDGYQLLGRLGRGGMGTVYLARREGSATHVALKAVHTELVREPELVRRFEREAEVLKLVDGAYTARILDTGLDGEQPYIVMELLDGLPLDRYVAEKGRIEAPSALRALAIAVAEALRSLHERGIVHRDIKPSNIMLTSGGPKLVDFGIVRVLAATRHTPTDQAMGTLAYMAPEQYDPKIPVGPAADVWAWACTVVHAATGESPFDSPDLPSVMNAVLERGPDEHLLERVRGIAPDLGRIVTAALSRDMAGRPASGAGLLALLSPEGTDSHTLMTKVNAGWTALHTGSTHQP